MILSWTAFQNGTITGQSHHMWRSEPVSLPHRQQAAGTAGKILCNFSGVGYQRIHNLYLFSWADTLTDPLWVCSQMRSQSSSDRSRDRSEFHEDWNWSVGGTLDSSKEYSVEIKWRCGRFVAQICSIGAKSRDHIMGVRAPPRKCLIWRNLKNGIVRCGSAVVISVWESKVPFRKK